MKKALLILALICSPTPAFGDCVGNIVDFYQGGNGEILVEAEFVVDGVKESVNDKKTFFPEKIAALSKAQIKTAIEDYLSRRCKQIIAREYKKRVDHPTVENRKSLGAAVVTALEQYRAEITAISGTHVAEDVLVDSDGDGYYDKQYRIETNGKKTITDITPTPADPVE